ncbi:hypothetical protein [Methylobacter sp.]|uniref:hypothetical protein n=1 Tax=Methylobacter sp. TaxID=2051955 RepID=UPI00120553D1|nr:hypothetical protein [Methylobacter sp.]TAK59994.1 MAG: hypothetical protein EPO18_18795 [Methylobacter sp.]
MPNQDEHDNRTEQPLSSPDLNDTEESFTENVVGTFKTLLFAIVGVALLLAIWVLLPMFLTYLSEGDYRAPSQIHPTDAASKGDQNPYKK